MRLVVVADALDLVSAGRHIGRGHHNDAHVAALLDAVHVLALLVEQEGGHVEGKAGENLAGLLFHGLFFHHAQNGECK